MPAPDALDLSLPTELAEAVQSRVDAAADADVVGRIWEHDETLWGGPGPEIGNRLGWLTIADRQLESADDLIAFAQQAQSDGFVHAALLGMGGSSLGPEVLRLSIDAPGGLDLHVLDSTDPASIHELESKIDIAKTLFVVSSKSGGTVETLSHMKHFYEATGGNGDQFVAVTDPGSGLVDIAAERGFRRTFENDPDIGGRYSVLSYFGLVPAALQGVDVKALLESAQEAEEAARTPAPDNAALWLGAALGELSRLGRNKATFVVSPSIAAFGLWVEQLIAESTGKQGRGILPVADEPLGAPEVYGDDRVIVYLRDEGGVDAQQESGVQALRDDGQPVITLAADGPGALGRTFFTWEFATAVAGWAIDINAFDQPNVQEAKDNTQKALGSDDPSGVHDASDDDLAELFRPAEPPRFVAIMGYVTPSEEFDEAIAELRTTIRDATNATTTYGYGPRFLHSTGQFHKGGPPQGLFLQLVHDVPPGTDVDVPESDFSFAELIGAQSAGDVQTLHDHELPAERVRLDTDDLAGSVRQLTEKLRTLLT